MSKKILLICVSVIVGSLFSQLHAVHAADYQSDYPDYVAITPNLVSGYGATSTFSDLAIGIGASSSPPINLVMFVFNADTGDEISNSGWDTNFHTFGNSILALISNCTEAPCGVDSSEGGNNIETSTPFGSINYPIVLVFGNNAHSFGNCPTDTLTECITDMDNDNDSPISIVELGSVEQYQSDGETELLQNGTTTSNSVVIQGDLFSASTSDELELQVELESASTSFSNTVTNYSDATTSGGNASITLSDLSDGVYHWQSRIMDESTSVASPWEPFDGTGDSDFIVGPIPSTYNYPAYFSVTPSTSSTDASPFSFSDLTFSSYGPNDLDSSNIASFVFDADTGVQISNSGWYLTNDGIHTTSTYTSNVLGIISACHEGSCNGVGHNGGSDFYDGTIGSITDPLVLIMTDNYSPNYGTCPTDNLDQCIDSRLGQDDFSMVTVGLSAAPSLTNLQQYKLDATTTISDGATTTESSVDFGATLNQDSTNTLQLQVEVEPTGTGFSDTPNASSTFVSPGGEAIATYISGTSTDIYPRFPETSSDGGFHWQARVFDGTNYSDWQTFGSDSTSTIDFTIDTVPIYTQIGSPYPSTASTTGTLGGWAYDSYDDGVGCADASSTIGYCGCAISSVVMWLQYYGIATDTNGNTVDPRDLNEWLENPTNDGYTPDGDLRWTTIENYASSSDGGAIVYDTTDYGTSTIAKVNNLLASSTPDPVILYEPDTPEGDSTTTHFVVATGLAQNNGTSTYTIRDSAWYLTQYLNESTSTDSSTTINGYSNEIENDSNDVDIFYDPSEPPLVDEYDVSLPDSLMLVDSQGRRTGKNPTTGTIYDEIPGTSYKEQGHSGQLFFSKPSNGSYTLYVLGGKTGSYWVEAGNTTQQTQIFRGTIQTGSMVEYQRNYNAARPTSSVFSFQKVLSSTASITSVPPHNLPPPLIPLPQKIPVSQKLLISSPAPVILNPIVPTSTLTHPTSSSLIQSTSSPILSSTSSNNE